MHLGAPFTILLATLALVGAAALHVKASPQRARAGALLESARADGSAYVATFDGAHLDAQRAHFKERRAALSAASGWLLARDLCVMLAGVLLAVAWVQAFLRRLESLRVDGAPEASRPPAPPPARPVRVGAS